MSVVIQSLTNRVSTMWGRRYCDMEWDNVWLMLIGIANKELKGLPPYNIKDPFHSHKQCEVNNCICWFDRNIIQQINPWDLSNEKTLRVRLRIVICMISESRHIPDVMLPRIIAAMTNIFSQFLKDAWDWRLKYLEQLPF